MMNTLKVGFLLSLLTALFVGIGYTLGGQNGMVMAFGFALLMNAGSYWFSDKIVLKMYGAREVTAGQEPELYQMTENLCRRANLPMPKLYVIDDPQPNAFATGRDPNHAAVAVNRGLLDLLNRDEVEGVVAHELAHVKHRDTLTMTIVATIAGAIMMLVQIAQFGAMFGGGRSDDDEGANPIVLLVGIIIAPIAATMIQMAVSRAREFEADASAARFTGSPYGLIGALGKLDAGTRQIPPAHANPQTAHMFIANPLAGLGGGLMSLFSTHPPMEKRIAALRALDAGSVGAPYTVK
jgi:heat shock protein HtpX